MTPVLIYAVHNGGRKQAQYKQQRIERRLTVLYRQRAKLLAMLQSHRLSPARKARLRQMLENIDEVIRLLKRLALH
jgi:hypothetical protein